MCYMCHIQINQWENNNKSSFDIAIFDVEQLISLYIHLRIRNTKSLNENELQKEKRQTLDMLIQKYELIRGHFYILQTHHEL